MLAAQGLERGEGLRNAKVRFTSTSIYRSCSEASAHLQTLSAVVGWGRRGAAGTSWRHFSLSPAEHLRTLVIPCLVHSHTLLSFPATSHVHLHDCCSGAEEPGRKRLPQRLRPCRGRYSHSRAQLNPATACPLLKHELRTWPKALDLTAQENAYTLTPYRDVASFQHTASSSNDQKQIIGEVSDHESGIHNACLQKLATRLKNIGSPPGHAATFSGNLVRPISVHQQ